MLEVGYWLIVVLLLVVFLFGIDMFEDLDCVEVWWSV